MIEIIKNPLVFQIIKSILIYSLLNCVLAILFERLLIIKGVVRGNTVTVIVFSILVTSLFELISLGDGINFIYELFIVFGTPLKLNQYDLSGTINKGVWWWNHGDGINKD